MTAKDRIAKGLAELTWRPEAHAGKPLHEIEAANVAHKEHVGKIVHETYDNKVRQRIEM